MGPAGPPRARHRRPHGGHEVVGRAQRAAPDDPPRDAAGVPFVAELEDDPGELRLGQPVEQVRGGLRAVRVEPHVERRRRLEGEPAAGMLELRGREAKIQQDGLGDADVVGAGDTVEVAEVAPPEDGPGAEAAQTGPRPRQRLGIAVDPEQPHLVRRPFQHRLGVSAHAHRSVDHPAPAAGA